MRAFQHLYTIARLLVALFFLAGIVMAMLDQGNAGLSRTLIVVGMGVLGLTPIFGLAIAGATWLRTRLTDSVGWIALMLAAFGVYLWLGR